MSPNPALLRRYRAQIGRYRDRTALAMVTAWDNLTNHDRQNVDEFVEVTAPALNGAKAAAVSLSAAFFALTLDVPPVGIDPADVDITPDTNGPFHATWHALAMGRPIDEAIRVGRSTAQAAGFDFIQRSARRTGDHVAAASGIEVRWARIPGAKSCDWCRSVAHDNYRTAESADFGHERDDCDVVPVAL